MTETVSSIHWKIQKLNMLHDFKKCLINFICSKKQAKKKDKWLQIKFQVTGHTHPTNFVVQHYN